MSNWPSYVHRETAEADGRRPEDFRFMQWPLSATSLAQPAIEMPREVALCYHANIPADTPRANRYNDEGQPLPDPVGMALSRVKFQLIDEETGATLDEDLSQHVDGKVLGTLAGESRLWSRLTPGAKVRVRATATPLFYFIDEHGAAQLGYSAVSGLRGYFAGTTDVSPVYELFMTADGEVLVDGASRPEAEAPPETDEERELRIQMEREWREAERERREAAERMRRQREEIANARAIITAQRDKYGSQEDWLLGVLFDQSLDFGTVRKHVHGLARELGVDLDAARKRRNEAREREAAERKRKHEQKQATQEQADNIKMVRGMFDMYFADTLAQKEALLRKVYEHPEFGRHKAAVEIVAAELGITL